MIINPDGMSFGSWANAVAQQVGMQSDTVRLFQDEGWRDWSKKLIALPVIANQSPPRPDYFDEWPAWAEAFNRSVQY
jgi:hypothetical protein